VAASRSHDDMLASAGFVDICEIDCTEEFVTTQRSWNEQWDAHRDHLEDLLGEAAFVERRRNRDVQLRATVDGLLRRTLFVAIRS
jgi:hypothetical protein